MKAYNEARHITKHTSTVLNSAFPADKLEYTGAQVSVDFPSKLPADQIALALVSYT